MTTMKGFIVYPTYRLEGDDAFLHFYGRLESGESFLLIKSFKPYFFIKEEDSKTAREVDRTLDIKKTDLLNFDGEKVSMIEMDNPRKVPDARDSLHNNEIPTYEADIRFVYRYIIDNALKGSIEIEGKKEDPSKYNASVDCVFVEPKIKPSSWNPKLKVLSFDIETNKDTEQLYAVSLWTDDYKKVLLNKQGKYKSAECFDNEQQVLERFKELIVELDPDIIAGWNCIDFDLDFLERKFKQYKIRFEIGRTKGLTKLRRYESYVQDSSADIVGRQVLDGMHLMRISFIRLDDYKLNTAAQKFLGKGKIIGGPNKYQEIVDSFENNTQKLVDYNLLDSELVYEILEKSGVLDLTIQRSLVTGMQLDRVKGSVASLDNLYLAELRKKGYVASTRHYTARERRITGGYVFDSKPGIYDYVIVCDFKSLYPSLMRTFNIDPLAYVPEDKVKNFKEKDLITAPNGARFKREKGIIPDLLENLLDKRTKAKKKGNILESNAIKVLMNSIFGVLANPNCRFYSFEMSNAITHFGQHFIKLTVEEIEKKGYEVIYGDSIGKDRFITILDEDNMIRMIKIEDLFNKYKSNLKNSRGKEFVVPKNVKTLSIDKKTLKPKFSKIKTVIRHRTNKKVFRINQKYGETVCSEDHSIININKNKVNVISPQKLAEDNVPFSFVDEIPEIMKLKRIDLYSFLKEYHYSYEYKNRIKTACFKIVEEKWLSFSSTNRRKPVLVKRFIENTQELEALCRLLGFYIAEGSSSTRETTLSKSGASMSTKDKKILEQMQKDYMLLFKNVKTKIIPSDGRKIRTIKQGKKVYKYNDETLKLQMMNEISAVFFKVLGGQKSSGKKIPEFIYHLPDKYKLLLIKYMVLGDGSFYDERYSATHVKKHFRYTTKSLQLLSGLSFLLKQLKIKYNIQYRESKNAYRISTSEKNNERLTTKIKEIKYDDYLYDLSAEDEMFVDGCGQILLHNTDSIFVNLKVDSEKKASESGNEIQSYINEMFAKLVAEEYEVKSYLELEFEKTYKMFLMPKVRDSDAGAKKRYAGLLLKDGKEELDFVGLEIVRRDWTELAKQFQMSIIDKIFHKKDPSSFIQRFVKDLKKGKHDGLLTYRKALRKELDEYTKTTPPHVKAARKMEEVHSGIIEYVMTVDGPEPLDQVKHSIDYEHYIDKQLEPIANAVLTFYGTSFEDVLKGTKQTSLFGF